MEQLKTVAPRVRALANTGFVKGGRRLVVSLLGVMMPSITPNPVMYTVLEDTSHGSNMICGALIDTLLEASKTMGALPRRVFIQADSTPEETKKHRGDMVCGLGTSTPRFAFSASDV